MSTFPIVIIGAGPAGIAAAVEAIKRGFKPEEIIIIEKFGGIAHTINEKYPDEKEVLANYKGKIASCIGEVCINNMSKREFFDYLETVVTKYSLQVNFNQEVKKVTKLRNGQFKVDTNIDTYICSVVFVAIGKMVSPRKMGASIDESVQDKIVYDLKKITQNDKDILVVGGGDSAGEFAKIMYDRGHNVTLSYRGKDFNRMIESNRKITEELILSKKIKFLPESHILKICLENGSAHVYFKDQHNSAPLAFDKIVASLGSDKPTSYLNSIGIGTFMEDDRSSHESLGGGLFFIGDLAGGKESGSINLAFNSGVNAMEEACYSYLDCISVGR